MTNTMSQERKRAERKPLTSFGDMLFTLRQRILTHEFARTTKLYDRTSDTISLDETDRIMI